MIRTLAVILTLLAALPAFAAESYLIQARDVLSIQVYGHAELSSDVTVLEDGGFSYPVVGRVEAVGTTPDAVARRIAAGLGRELANPSVAVGVKQAAPRRVYAAGTVSKPGSFELQPGWRLSHLIAEAGGLTGRADLQRAVLVRGEKSLDVDLASVLGGRDPSADLEVLPGDLLQIQPDTNLIHVVGQVKNPGEYQLKSRLGVLEAVAMAGGTTENAALTRAQVIRGADVKPVNLHALLVEGRVEGNLELAAGDTLMVPANEARVAVLGAVGRPGYYDLPDGKTVTVADALGLAGGALKNARLGEVALVRASEGSSDVTRINVGNFLKKGDLTQNPAVATGDVVYVAEGKEPITRSGILSAVTAFTNPIIYSILRR